MIRRFPQDLTLGRMSEHRWRGTAINYKIALIRGDGIGPEIVNETVKVIDKVGEKFGHSFEYVDVLLGGCATDAVGVSYPEGTA